MYEIFEQLLQKYGVSTYKVSKDTKISQTIFSNWKTGRSIPKQDKLQKIADYFGVSVDYLMTGKEIEEKESAISTKDERNISLKIQSILEQLKSCEDDLIFEDQVLDKKLKQLLMLNLENSINIVKLMQDKK